MGSRSRVENKRSAEMGGGGQQRGGYRSTVEPIPKYNGGGKVQQSGEAQKIGSGTGGERMQDVCVGGAGI